MGQALQERITSFNGMLSYVTDKTNSLLTVCIYVCMDIKLNMNSEL